MLNARWYAIYTKSRNEKKLADRLSLKGFEVYCPTQTVYKQWADRKKKVQEVLFKSYLFVRFELNDQLEVLQTPGAVALLKWLGKPAEIRDEEIEAIEHFLNDYTDVKVTSINFREGEQLKVKEGSLQNNYGTLIRQTKHKVFLQLEKLGMSVVAELPKSQVEKT